MKKYVSVILALSLLLLPFDRGYCMAADAIITASDQIQEQIIEYRDTENHLIVEDRLAFGHSPYLLARSVPASEVFGESGNSNVSDQNMSQPNISVQQTKEQLWKKELSDAKTLRTVYWVLGLGGVVGGTLLGIQGYQEEQDEEAEFDCRDVGGGFVECTEKEDTSTNSKTLIGILAFLGGLGFVFGAVGKGKLVKQLEENGRKSGFQLGLDPIHFNRYKLEYVYHFGAER